MTLWTSSQTHTSLYQCAWKQKLSKVKWWRSAICRTLMSKSGGRTWSASTVHILENSLPASACIPLDLQKSRYALFSCTSKQHIINAFKLLALKAIFSFWEEAKLVQNYSPSWSRSSYTNKISITELTHVATIHLTETWMTWRALDSNLAKGCIFSGTTK